MALSGVGIHLVNGPTQDGERAACIRVGNTFTITAQLHADTHLSFTLWHEMFEILREHGAFPVASKAMTLGHAERLADLFASHVLMPPDLVREAAEHLHHPEQDKALNLAARFGVSITAMKRSLRTLGLQYKDKCHPKKYF